MEIAVEGIGSLGGGGRYDNLVGMFLGRDVPACGFSLGLERIIVVMTERDMFPATVVRGAVDIVVTFWTTSRAPRRCSWPASCGRRGFASTCSRRRPQVRASRSSTRRRAARRAMAIFGENERARGEVGVRNLQTREQVSVPRADAASHIARL